MAIEAVNVSTQETTNIKIKIYSDFSLSFFCCRFQQSIIQITETKPKTKSTNWKCNTWHETHFNSTSSCLQSPFVATLIFLFSCLLLKIVFHLILLFSSFQKAFPIFRFEIWKCKRNNNKTKNSNKTKTKLNRNTNTGFKHLQKQYKVEIVCVCVRVMLYLTE